MKNLRIQTIAIILLGIGFVNCAEEGRDFVLVVDTSGSMAVPVGESGDQQAQPEDSYSTMKRIQQNIPLFMARVREGDRVSVMPFNGEVRDVRSFEIKKKADKLKVVDYISSLEAAGRYTDMQTMLVQLRQLTARLSSDQRRMYVVVMSDGRDDPPPGSKRDELNLDDLRDSRNPEEARPLEADYYVYYVSLGKLQDKKLAEGLEDISGNEVKIVEPGQTGEGDNSNLAGEAGGDPVGLGEVSRNIEQIELLKSPRFWAIVIVGLLFLIFSILLWIWLINKFLNRHKPRGKLDYYDPVSGPSMMETKKLGKVETSKFSLGGKIGADVKIRDLGIDRIFLKAGKKNGKPVIKIRNARDKKLFDFEKQAVPDVISNGDKFKLGNFIFEYKDGSEK